MALEETPEAETTTPRTASEVGLESQRILHGQRDASQTATEMSNILRSRTQEEIDSEKHLAETGQRFYGQPNEASEAKNS